MSLLGKWRIVEMPDYDAGYADMMDPAYIHFRENGSGEFAFGGGDTDAAEFTWDGNDEMDEARGDGWAELQHDGVLKGQICFHSGDEAEFIARRNTSSTAC